MILSIKELVYDGRDLRLSWPHSLSGEFAVYPVQSEQLQKGPIDARATNGRPLVSLNPVCCRVLQQEKLYTDATIKKCDPDVGRAYAETSRYSRKALRRWLAAEMVCCGQQICCNPILNAVLLETPECVSASAGKVMETAPGRNVPHVFEEAGRRSLKWIKRRNICGGELTCVCIEVFFDARSRFLLCPQFSRTLYRMWSLHVKGIAGAPNYVGAKTIFHNRSWGPRNMGVMVGD